MKRCPCGRGYYYTGENAKHSPVVNGKRVCQECFIDHLYNQHFNREDG